MPIPSHWPTREAIVARRKEAEVQGLRSFRTGPFPFPIELVIIRPQEDGLFLETYEVYEARRARTSEEECRSVRELPEVYPLITCERGRVLRPVRPGEVPQAFWFNPVDFTEVNLVEVVPEPAAAAAGTEAPAG